MTKPVLFLILTGVLLLGCSSKRADPVSHEKAKDTRALPLGPHDDKTDNTGLTIQDAGTFKSIEEIKNDAELANDIVQMAKSVLNENMIIDPRPYKDNQLTDNLHSFNQKLLRTFKLKSTPAEISKIYQKYEALLLKGIEKLERNYFKYFSRSHLSAEVYGHIIERRWLQLGSKMTDDDLIVDYRRLGALMFDVGNKTASPFLQGLYLTKALPYTKALQALGTTYDKELQRHINFTSNMLDEIIVNLNKNCKINAKLQKVECLSPDDLALFNLVQKFNDSIDIWSFGKSEGVGIASLKSKLIKLGLNSMYDEKGQISKSLSHALMNSQSDDDSFLKRLLELKKHVGVLGLKELGLDVGQYLTADDKLKPEFFNIYFYIVASLFKGKISREAAKNIWDSSRDAKKEMLLLQSIEAYIRVNLLAMTVETQKRLQKYFYDDKYTANNDGRNALIDDVFNEAKALKPKWIKIKDGIIDLAALAQTFAQKYDVEDPNSNMNKIYDMQSAISKNIGLLSAYPNQLMMLYLIFKNSNLNALQALEQREHEDMFYKKLSVYAMGGNKAIPQRIFDFESKPLELGILLPWFEFGNGQFLGADDSNSRKLTKWDMLYAHIFGAATKVFAPPGQNVATSFSRDIFTFADDLITSVLNPEIKGLERASKELFMLLSDTSYTSDFSDMCNTLRSTQNQWRGGDLKVLTHFKHNFLLMPFSVVIGQGEETKSELPTLEKKSALNHVLQAIPDPRDFRTEGADQAMASAVGRITVKNKRQITYLKAWLAFIEKFYLAAMPDEAVQIKAQADRIRNRIQSFENQQRAVLTRAKFVYDEVANCVNTVLEYETLVRNRIITDEIEGLGLLYDSYKANPQAPDKSRYDRLREKVQFLTAEDYEFKGNTFKISKIGALINVRDHVTRITGGTMDIPSGFAASKQFQDAIGLFKEMNFNQSREAFQKTGASYQFGDKSVITGWTTSQVYRNNYLYYGLNLFNVGPVDFFAGPAEQCNAAVILSDAILKADSGCKPKTDYLVTADQVIDDALDYIELFNITPEAYNQIYKYTGRTSVDSDMTNFTQKYLSDKSPSGYVSILSPLYQSIIQPINANRTDNAGGWGIYPIVEALNLRDSVAAEDLLIFAKEDQSYLAILKDLYRPYVTDFMKPALDFERAMAKRAKAYVAAGGKAFDITYERSAAVVRSMHFDPASNRAVFIDEDAVQANEKQRVEIFELLHPFFDVGVSKESKPMTIEQFKSPFDACISGAEACE